jgi:hypothetical protein
MVVCCGGHGSQLKIAPTVEVNLSFFCHKNVTIAPRGLNRDESQEREKRKLPPL